MMNRYQIALVKLILFAVVCGWSMPLPAQDSPERVWKDKSGKFSVKARLIKVDGNTVFLRRSDNGKTAKVPLGKLSKNDRDFLAGSGSPAGTGSSKSELKLSGKMIWSDAEFGFGDEEPRRLLQLEIIARGKAAAEALEFGMLKLDSMSSEEGKELQPRKERFAMNDLSRTYKKVDRNDKFFAKHPKNGVRVLIDIEAEDEMIKKVAEAKGSFKIKTGGDSSSFKIENTGSMDGQAVEMQQFADLGVKAEIKIQNQMLSLELDGNHSAIQRVEVHQPSGKKYGNFSGSGEGGGGSLHQFQFYFNDSVPEDAVMTVHVVENAEEMSVPFEFSDLKVPAKPKKDSF